MDFRAVVIFLYLLNAQAACGIIRNGTNPGAMNATIQQMREEINTTLGYLAKPGLLPDIPCKSLSITELVGLEQQPFTAHHLSSFRCYMLKMSDRTPELSSWLNNISQFTLDVSNHTVDCSRPASQQDADDYMFVKCLLELLDQRLSKATF